MINLDSTNLKMGVSPIAWSNDDMHDLGGEISLEQCLSEASQAGYAGIELGHKFPKNPEILKPILDKYNLELISGWHSTYFTQKEKFDEEIDSFKKHLDFLKGMGARVVICAECNKSRHSSLDASPRKKGEPLFSDEEWKWLCDGLNQAGKLAKEAGLKLVYHHHMGTGIQTSEELDRLMRNTDPDLVYLLGDTGHMLYAEMNPIEIFEKYAKRIAHIHLKDIRKEILQKVEDEKINFLNSVRMGIFTVPGDGCIDFDPVFEILAKANYSGWLVMEAEQDPQKANPFECAKKSRDFLREKIGI